MPSGRSRASEELVVVPRGAGPLPHGLVILRKQSVVAHATRVVEQVPYRTEFEHAVTHQTEHRGGDHRLREAVDCVPSSWIARDLDGVAGGDDRRDGRPIHRGRRYTRLTVA